MWEQKYEEVAYLGNPSTPCLTRSNVSGESKQVILNIATPYYS